MRVAKNKLFAIWMFAALSLPMVAADFTVESAGAPPSDTPEAIRSLLQSEGHQVKDSDGELVAEYWGRAAEFEAEPVSGFGIRFSSMPEGALIGIVRFPEEGSDFREQEIPPGVYTLRYTLHPEDGNHMGVAPSRDFAAVIPASEDKEPKKAHDYATVVALARKTGNPHPTIARLTLPEGSDSPNLWQNDYGHWVLDFKIPNDVVGIVVYGHSEE